MPSVPAIFRWMEANEDFRKQYARARQVQAEVYADEIVELANTPNVGIRVKQSTKNGREVIRGDNVERSKLQVDARKWVSSKLLPKKYGNVPDTGDERKRRDKLDELESIFRSGPIETNGDSSSR